MNAVYLKSAESEALFAAADAKYREIKQGLVTSAVLAGSHAEAERWLDAQSKDLLCKLFQSHLTLRGQAEPVGPVVGSDGVERTHVRREQSRGLVSVFGPVEVTRIAYSGRHLAALHPVDAELNLPDGRYSHEVERQVALTAARNSFDATVETVGRTTGAHVPKRQAEALVRHAAQDFEAYYANFGLAPHLPTSELLVLSFDGKGVVMRKGDLNPETLKVSEDLHKKLDTRASKGEQRGRKRMATVAAVYTVAPYVRTGQEIIAGLRHIRDTQKKPRPRPEFKRVWASLTRQPQQVIADAFDEAAERDPGLKKCWLVLIDGDPKLDRWVRAEAKRRGVTVTLVLDFIHALEYLWKASYAFHKEGTKEAEAWVLDQLARVLDGKVSQVAAGIRRMATQRGLTKIQRAPVDKAALYMLKRKEMMRYDELLALGAPIASGIIEGACRHLIGDRLDLTGARWRLAGAEAVLRLRSLLSSGDFDGYWEFHEQEEARRNHASRYADGKVPEVAMPKRKPDLRVVR